MYLVLGCNFYELFLSNLAETNVSRPKLGSFSKIDFSIWWYTCITVFLRVVVSSSAHGNDTQRFDGYHGNRNIGLRKPMPIQYQHVPSEVSKKHI